MKCPCHSNALYTTCCKPFHKGEKTPPHCVDLMRSRYSAYALSLPSYIIETTHPQNNEYTLNRTLWEKQLLTFCHSTTFKDLIIHSTEETQKSGTVDFSAILFQGSQNISFREISQFEKIAHRWLYLSGIGVAKALF